MTLDKAHHGWMRIYALLQEQEYLSVSLSDFNTQTTSFNKLKSQLVTKQIAVEQGTVQTFPQFFSSMSGCDPGEEGQGWKLAIELTLLIHGVVLEIPRKHAYWSQFWYLFIIVKWMY